MACQRANRQVAQARIWYCFVILMRMQENNQQRGFLCRISMLVGGLEHFLFSIMYGIIMDNPSH